MKRLRHYFAWLLAVLFIVNANACCKSKRSSKTSKKPEDRLLFVISLDGFRPDYINRDMMGALREFYRAGVIAQMMNVFPTKTFVNHFSIATGNYSESHGVTGNSLYDMTQGLLEYGPQLFKQFPQTTPFWTLNEMNGKSSGCMMWPGSEFEYRGRRCTYTQVLNKTMPLKERVDMSLSWMLNTKNPANLVVFYSQQPDDMGHRYGIDSQQLNGKLKEVNDMIGYVQQQLKRNNLFDRTDIIILSDHGMLNLPEENFIDLYQYVNEDDVDMYSGSPVLQVVAKDPSRQDEICQQLKDAAANDFRFNAYDMNTLPEDWHVNIPERFGPCVAVAEPTYAFQDFEDVDIWFPEVKRERGTIYGLHGYDPIHDSMRPLFTARGPSFRQGANIVKQFKNIDLYNLVRRLLNLTPSTSDIDGDDPVEIWRAMLTILV